MANQPFSSHASVRGFASKIEAITPNDSADVTTVLQSLRAGSAGNVSIACEDGGAAVLITDVAAGEHIPGPIWRVFATGTTATNLVGWS